MPDKLKPGQVRGPRGPRSFTTTRPTSGLDVNRAVLAHRRAMAKPAPQPSPPPRVDKKNKSVKERPVRSKKGSVLGRAARAAYKYGGPFAGAGTKGTARAAGLGAVGGAAALGQVAAGIARGKPVGQVVKETGTGMAIGAMVGAAAPRIIGRVALPVAAITGAVDIGKAAVAGAGAVGARRHLKKHAIAARRAGVRATQHMLTGAVKIKPQTEAERKRGEEYYRRRRQQMGSPSPRIR